MPTKLGRQPPKVSETAVVFGLLVVFCAAALVFVSGPIFEGPDELEHYRYIDYVATTGTLPAPDAQPHGQYHQPPAYYLLAAPLLRLLGDPSPASFGLVRNPHYPGEISFFSHDNKNLYLHPAVLENSPAARAVRGLRLLSVVLGLATCVVVWRAAWLLFPHSPPLRLLMTALAALLPQFVYLSSVINNDSLLIFLASAVLYLLLKYQASGLTAGRAVLLGLLCGAILLTKTNGVFFGLVVAAAFAFNRSWWRWLPVSAAAVLVVVGGWYGRNWIDYHDLFLTGAWQKTWASDVIHSADPLASLVLKRLPYAYGTTWARFGSGAVTVAPLVNRIGSAVLLIGLAGCIVGAVTARFAGLLRKQWLIIGFSILAWVVTLVYLTSRAWSGNQGRYLLPGLLGWSAVLTAGMSFLMPVRWRALLCAGIVGLLAISLGVSVVDFVEVYRPLPPAVPELTLNYRYDDAAELVGVSPAVIHAAPGDQAAITLTWRAVSTPDRSLKMFIHSVLPDGQPMTKIVWRDSYPGMGNLLSQDWLPGRRWSEQFILSIPPDAAPQQVVDLIVGLYVDGAAGAPFPAVRPDGSETIPYTAALAISGARTNVPTVLARFGDAIGLTRITQPSGEFCINWAALRDGGADVRRFVHFLDQTGQLLGQSDGDPRSGQYPARYWQQGETIHDCVPMIDPKAARVEIGWYDPATGVRLPAADAAGTPLANDVYSWALP